MSPQERHEDVMRRYPSGLTPAQFRHETLASADSDGQLDPPALSDWFVTQSLLLRMWMDGLITRRCKRNEAGPYYITDAGRAAIAKEQTPAATDSRPRGSCQWSPDDEEAGYG